MIGKMDRRISVLRYRDNLWEPAGGIWGEVSQRLERRIFSHNAAAGTSTVYVTTYKDNNISFTDLLEFDGGKHMITAFMPKENNLYHDVVLSRVAVKRFAYETYTQTTNELNRMERCAGETMHFDAVMAEKYVRARDNDVHSTEEGRFILIVPKAFSLAGGTVVRAEGVSYVVKVRHEIGEHLNEYEIVAEGDV